jgi:transcriptional regulator with XRE-family HTH domain
VGDLADDVRTAIRESGLSRYEIAQKTGVSQSVLSRFMSGETGMTLATLERIAPLLGLEIVIRKRRKKER